MPDSVKTPDSIKSKINNDLQKAQEEGKCVLSAFAKLSNPPYRKQL
jgi:hypothetical protein